MDSLNPMSSFYRKSLISTEAARRRPANPPSDTITAMRREPGATGRAASAAGADPAEAWIKEWRRLIPPPGGVWWRKSAFDLARARRANRLRPWRWLTEPVATFRIWLATGRLSPAERARWNRRAEVAADADPVAVGPGPVPAAGRRVLRRPGDGHRRRRVRQDPDDGGAGGLRRPPPPHAAPRRSPSSRSPTRPPRRSGQRTRERLPGLQVGTIHQLARAGF